MSTTKANFKNSARTYPVLSCDGCPHGGRLFVYEGTKELGSTMTRHGWAKVGEAHRCARCAKAKGGAPAGRPAPEPGSLDANAMTREGGLA